MRTRLVWYEPKLRSSPFTVYLSLRYVPQVRDHDWRRRATAVRSVRAWRGCIERRCLSPLDMHHIYTIMSMCTQVCADQQIGAQRDDQGHLLRHLRWVLGTCLVCSALFNNNDCFVCSRDRERRAQRAGVDAGVLALWAVARSSGLGFISLVCACSISSYIWYIHEKQDAEYKLAGLIKQVDVALDALLGTSLDIVVPICDEYSFAFAPLLYGICGCSFSSNLAQHSICCHGVIALWRRDILGAFVSYLDTWMPL